MEAPVQTRKVGWYSPNKTWQEHFWLYTRKPENETTDCWIWGGAIRKKDGYTQMEIVNADGIRTLRTAHQASWLLHNGAALQAGLVLRHTCDNKLCVNPHHLLPGTQRENVQDMITRGRKPRGEKCPQAKLTEEKVRMIRQRAASGESFASIARDFEISRSQIGRICKGERWAHIKMEAPATSTT